MKDIYSEDLINKIIGMAWADEISFDRIKKEHGLSEAAVIKIMRKSLKPGSYKVWRKRVTGRPAKHEKRTRALREMAQAEES